MGDTEVIFYDYGPSKLEVVKFVKAFLKVGLAEAKAICEATEQAPQTFNMYGADAKEFTATLQKLGAKVEMHPKGANRQTATTVTEEIDRIKELEKRIEALESRIAKLEKAPVTSPAAASGKREVITHHKYVGGDSLTDYYKTSEGRVLDAGYHRKGTIDYSDYLIELKKNLIEIGEEDAVDLKDLTTETLKEAKNKNSARFEQFITQITRLATKYGSKGTIPALLPNDAVLSTSGQVRRTSVTKKAIKF